MQAGERVCAVVVTWNRRDLLSRCLAAVVGQTRPPDAVLVVDNASTDGTLDSLARSFPEAHVLRLPRNIGCAGGCAEGLGWVLARDFDWAWLMDDDVAASKQCLQELLEVAALSGKRVVAPRKLSLHGEDCANEAILVEEAQRLDRVATDPARERYRLVDLFTFEGPLMHRSVMEAAGLPHPGHFIRGDDMLYGIRINRRCGPLGCALAPRAVMQRLLPPAAATVARSRVKAWITGDPTYRVLADPDHWKMVYTLRNRHLMWRELGWHRRRLRLAVTHLGYIGADLWHAMRQGWHWRLRLRWNVIAWGLGVRGRETAFLDPQAYRERVAARPRRAGAAG